MAAPSDVTRATPAGIPLEDGFSSVIAFAADTDISFWEKTVQPPGVDNGDSIDQTTMHNTTYRTKSARTLLDITNGALTVAYDPEVYNQIIALCGVETSVTVTFSDGSTLSFWGYLQNFVPDPLTDGAQPEASISVVATNWDPTNKVEAAPVMTEVSGT